MFSRCSDRQRSSTVDRSLSDEPSHLLYVSLKNLIARLNTIYLPLIVHDTQNVPPKQPLCRSLCIVYVVYYVKREQY